MGKNLKIFESVLADKGSRYAVSGSPCDGVDNAKSILRQLRRNKKFARATHHSWAFLSPNGPVKNDDGETGAGMVIVRMLERASLNNHLVIVTRWYGGKKLGGDRFRHIQTAVRYYLEQQ